MTWRAEHCEAALHELKRRFPYHWDLNAYRGCGHGCVYCYARYAHPEDGVVRAKVNLVECLEREMTAPGWKREIVNLGGVTDSYQPAEADCRLMPDVLRLLIRTRTPAIISTKSDLPLRDFDLIDELSRLTYVNVAASVTTLDEDVRKRLEPGAVPTERRFAMLAAFRKTNASVGVHMMPIVPMLTDAQENLERLLARSRDCGAHYVLPGVMYLRGQTRAAFFSAVERDFPEALAPLRALYGRGGAGEAYKEALYARFLPARERCGLTGNYSAVMKEKMQ